jgi:transcription-repair coupling factor (superfamily II helicase)
VIDAGGRIGRDFAPERQNEKLSLFGALAAHVKARLARGRGAGELLEGSRERMENLLEDEETGETIPVTDFSRVGRSGIHLAVWPLEHGFEAPGLTVISEQDVLGDRLIRQTRKRRRPRTS